MNMMLKMQQIAQKVRDVLKKDEGMATVEYAIVLVAAAGLAGLLVLLLKSDTVKTMLEEMITNAFTTQ